VGSEGICSRFTAKVTVGDKKITNPVTRIDNIIGFMDILIFLSLRQDRYKIYQCNEIG
jgi:hypothetical protein